MLLSDFPMATLQPMFRAVPALQNAAPAVTAGGPGAALPGLNLSSSSPFSGLALPFMRHVYWPGAATVADRVHCHGMCVLFVCGGCKPGHRPKDRAHSVCAAVFTS